MITMRRLTSVFVVMAAIIMLPRGVAAQSETPAQTILLPSLQPAVTQQLWSGQMLTPQQGLKLQERQTPAVSRPSADPLRRAPRKVISQIADLSGDYVQTYKSLTASIGSGGHGVTVTPVEGTDSILIANFWDTGIRVKAAVNLEQMTITIPNQVVGYSSAEGDVEIAFCTSTGAPDRSQPIEGTINDDGTLSISSWWGMYTSEDKFFGVYYDAFFEAANGTMRYTRAETKDDDGNVLTTSSGSYPVIVAQVSKNIVTVKNFANYGQTIEIILNRDRTALIESQTAREDPTNGDWSTIVPVFTGTSLTSYQANIVCNAATDAKKITWNDWSLLCTKFYLGHNLSGEVEADFDIVYPEVGVTEFQGKGTQEEPFLIRTADDLILLSDLVNQNEDYNYAYGSNTYARVYQNTFFRLENDIDLESMRFTPIGADFRHRFAGEFDGQGYTIKNLNVSTRMYGGLFGLTDTLAVISNLNLDAPHVVASSSYAASLVASNLGRVENCSADSAWVECTGSGLLIAGLVGGSQGEIKDCHVVNSTIVGVGGYNGGIAGETIAPISNCYVENTIVVAGGSTNTPTGGVVGNLYQTTGSELRFAGLIIPYSSEYANLNVGGVIGRSYMGTIDKCFAVATMSSYGSMASTGGVAGVLSAATMTNCYSIGRIVSSASRYAGGLVGQVLDETTVRSCYTATVLDAETYLYDTSETREIIGHTDTSATTIPVYENIYFDKQLTNFHSTRFGATTSELVDAAGPKGFSADDWVFTEGFYPRLKGMEQSVAAKSGATAILMDGDVNYMPHAATINKMEGIEVGYVVDRQLVSKGNFSVIEGNVLTPTDFGTDSVYICEGIVNRFIPIKMAPVSFAGSGTEDDPHLIKTKQDLVDLSVYTTVNDILFDGIYFRMMNDIDLEKTPEFLGICANSESGRASSKFGGVFDGGGFTIHNMYLNRVVWKENAEPVDHFADGTGTPETGVSGPDRGAYAGFIGRLGETGVLRNLTIADDADLRFWATSAALVGYNYGLIENCRNYATVNGLSCWIGGICGQGVANSIIRNCYNAGDIYTGYMDVGGIVGTTYGRTENCVNTGQVAVKKLSEFMDPAVSGDYRRMNFAGGISGTCSTSTLATLQPAVQNCVNYGMVSAPNGKVGGIFGSISGNFDALNNINLGDVFAGDFALVGAIGGNEDPTGQVAGNLWDAQLITWKANGNKELEGTTGVETSQLTSGSALEGFDTDIWQFDAGMYPTLKAFAGEAKVLTARTVLVKVASGETVADLSSAVELSLPEGSDASLTQNTDFTLSDNVITVPANVSAVTNDTLVINSSDFLRIIALAKKPVLDLQGEGTKDNPYQLSKAADWNTLADYMALCGESFKDKYVKVMNDFSFEGIDFKPLAYDQITAFQGDLDGNQKTISGISYTAVKAYEAAIDIAGADANIHDLTLAGDIESQQTTPVAHYVAGFVGKAYGTFTNCVNKINVNSIRNYSAGFVNTAYAGAYFLNCGNEGDITSSGTNVGGFAYSVGGDVTLEGCYNKGAIHSTTTSAAANVGGLVSVSANATYTGCWNEGTIEMAATTASVKPGRVAGLIANLGAAKGTQLVLKNCWNTADIMAASMTSGLTGVATANSPAIIADSCWNSGDIYSNSPTSVTSTYTAGLSVQFTPGSRFTNCYNTGSVMVDNTVYVGGLLCYGVGSFNETDYLVVKKCWNEGDVFAGNGQGGGVVTYPTAYAVIDSCYNQGEITGTWGLGGIVATMGAATATLTNSWNEGTITASQNRAGGIVGYGTQSATVENCFNTGNISLTLTSNGSKPGAYSGMGYGVGGLAGHSASKFTNCYNTGTITGATRVAGLVGMPSASNVNSNTGELNNPNTQLFNCYNAGRVVCNAEFAFEESCDTLGGIGNIIGTDPTNIKNWRSDVEGGNTATNCFYMPAISGVFAYDSVAKDVKVGELTADVMGEAFVADDFCLPVLQSVLNDAARLNAAIVTPAADDTYDNITGDFAIGVPEGVEWTASADVVAISGNSVIFNSPYSGQLIMTAKLGSRSKSYLLNCNVVTTGINGTQQRRYVVSEEIYSTSGQRLLTPVRSGQVVVVKRVYSDGTQQTSKEMR